MRKLNDLCNHMNLNEIFFIVGKKTTHGKFDVAKR